MCFAATRSARRHRERTRARRWRRRRGTWVCTGSETPCMESTCTVPACPAWRRRAAKTAARRATPTAARGFALDIFQGPGRVTCHWGLVGCVVAHVGKGFMCTRPVNSRTFVRDSCARVYQAGEFTNNPKTKNTTTQPPQKARGRERLITPTPTTKNTTNHPKKREGGTDREGKERGGGEKEGGRERERRGEGRREREGGQASGGSGGAAGGGVGLQHNP